MAKKLTEMFFKAWALERQRKGLPPIPDPDEHRVKKTGPSIFHTSKPIERPFYTKPVAQAEFPAENPIHQRWQDTMDVLALHLQPVFEWCQTQDPGVIARLSILEDQCRDLAIIGDQEAFEKSMTPYFTVLGKLVMTYMGAGQPLSCIDLISLRFGLKQVRVHVDGEEVVQTDENVIEIQATEIPALLAATPEQLADIVKVKSFFPGAHVVGS